MNTRGWKGPAVGVAALLLVLLGAHLAWERHRVRLWTPRGTVSIGMTKAEVEAVLGPATATGPPGDPTESWNLDGRMHRGRELIVDFHLKGDGRCVGAAYLLAGGSIKPVSHIPRPSLFGHVRSWFGKREE